MPLDSDSIDFLQPLIVSISIATPFIVIVAFLFEFSTEILDYYVQQEGLLVSSYSTSISTPPLPSPSPSPSPSLAGVDCRLLTIPNGEVRYSPSGSPVFQTIAIHTCNEGALFGSGASEFNRTCQADGEWSLSEPVCNR